MCGYLFAYQVLTLKKRLTAANRDLGTRQMTIKKASYNCPPLSREKRLKTTSF